MVRNYRNSNRETKNNFYAFPLTSQKTMYKFSSNVFEAGNVLL